MSRSADIHRTTSETDVELSAGARRHGRGRAHHRGRLLRPPAGRRGPPRRARSRRARGGRPRDRPAPHGRGHRHRARAALDEALGDRAGIVRFGHAVDPDGRGPRELRDRHVRAGRSLVVRGATFRRGDRRTSTPTSPRSSSARWPTAPSSRCTCGWRPARTRTTWSRRRFKAFARALRAAVAIDPRRDRRALHQGGPVSARIAILDYGMGNLRSVEKALEHVGAEPRADAATTTQVRGADGVVLPGVGALPKAMEHVRRARPRRAAARARGGRACPCSASAWACSCCSSPPTELGGAEGIGLLGGPVAALERRRPEGAADRLEPGRAGGAPRGSDRGPARPVRLLPRALLRARARRRRRTCSAPPTTAASSSAPWRADAVYGVQFHPEKSGPARAAAARELRCDLRARGASRAA